jgi:hypothetical protein
MGKPVSNSVTRGTWPEISTWPSTSRVGPRSSTTSRPSASRSAPVGKVTGVVGEREPAHALGPGRQDVDEVVDHQGDLDGVDRLQLDHAG